MNGRDAAVHNLQRPEPAGRTSTRKDGLVTRFAPSLLALASVSAASAQDATSHPTPVLESNPARAAAGHYALDPAHTSVTMRLSHMGLSNYTIRFDRVAGGYDYDPAHVEASPIRIVIDAASIDTGNPKFDALIARSFLHADKSPQITFVSDAIRRVKNHGTVSGTLDLNSVRRPVTLDVDYHGYAGVEHPERMGFSATTRLKRSDFGIAEYVPAEGDDVSVMIETEFRRDAPAAERPAVARRP